MNRSRQAQWCLAFFIAGQILIFSAVAETTTNFSAHLKLFSARTNVMPPMPPPSPVDFFRNLLAMSPQEREKFLAGKAPALRERLLAKINEYDALNPGDRELRLRATELRWYLMPLLRASPTNRAAQLARVPDNILDLVKSRLMQWQILPPTLQQEFLENENTLRYFSHVDASTPFSSAPTDADQSRWNALSDNQRKAVTAQFNQFFELSPAEKQKSLGALSDSERAQMEKTLQAFDKLPPPQRMECVHAFAKFAEMNPQDRAEFLKNAQRWAEMSPVQRKAWRDLVAHVPQWPPLPPAMIMPPIPRLPKSFHPVVATNHG